MLECMSPQLVVAVPGVDNGDVRHWCPGCQKTHILPWRRGGWTYNGDPAQPTFMPSFRHSWNEWEGTADAGRAVAKVCHYIITGGVLAFCADCTHALAGKIVPMTPIPEGASWV